MTRAPFQAVMDAGWQPSPDMQLLALQRRRDRLCSPTQAELAFNRILERLGLEHGRDYEFEAVRFYPRSFALIDFLCESRGIAFEVDGRIHRETTQQAHDAGRDAYFAAQGIRTVRLRNSFILARPDICARLAAKELGLTKQAA